MTLIYIPCLIKRGEIVLITLYVDDIIIIGNADELIKEIKEKMPLVCDMKDLGDLHYCLGLEASRVSCQNFPSQGKYGGSLFKNFIIDQCKAATVPLQVNINIRIMMVLRRSMQHCIDNWLGI